MAWVTPTTRATGYLVTAATWNQDAVDNPSFLKGLAGAITLQDAVQSDTDDVDDIGTGALRWRNGFFMRLLRGTRQVLQLWDNVDADMTTTSQQVSAAVTGAGAGVASDGNGQITLLIDRAQVGTARVEQLAETNGLDNAWTIARHPALVIPFGLGTGGISEERIFIGFRATAGSSAIPGTAENQAGLHWDGTNWFCRVSDGATATSGANFTPNVGWNVLQIVIRSATRVEFFVNGVSRGNLTTTLPTGTLIWHILHTSVGGGAGNRYLTAGEVDVQEQPA